jgi:predicted RNA polymerase sigma factor
MPRLKQQFETALKRSGPRYELDKAFLEVFGKSVEEDETAWQRLRALYEQLADETLFHS